MFEKHLKLVAKTIRATREAKGHSQEGFAAMSDMDRSRYGRIERGEVNISLKTLFLIAGGLDVKPSTLIDAVTPDMIMGVSDVGDD